MKKPFHFLSIKIDLAAAGVCAALLAFFLSGCATGKKTEGPKPTFFPPAPDEPRVQFLTAFSSDVELGRPSSFADYITGKTTPANRLIKPYGLAVHDGKIYVCDTMASALEIFDLSKRRSRYFMPRGENRMDTPINVSIDADGTRYVADTGRSMVMIYGKDDSFRGVIGGKDEMKPCDVAITADRLYVADLKNHAVRVYAKADRKFLFSIPRDGAAPEAKLFSPTNLAIDKDGRLLVSDTGGFAVQIYDFEGKHLRSFGQQGVGPGLFARPKGLAVDRDGLTYVVDATTQVVQVFDPAGKLLMFFGQPGASTYGELILPAAVKIDYDSARYFQNLVAPGYQCEYLILVTSQFGSRMVNVYGFVKKK